MKEKGISQYDLYAKYGVGRSLLDRLRHDKNIQVTTVDKLCQILQCDVSDIMEYIPEVGNKKG